MMYEYVQVTKSGGQTLDCVGMISQKTYKNVEIVENHGVDSPPEVGAIGVLLIVQNAEYVWIGNLQQFLSGLMAGEMRIHPGHGNGVLLSGQAPADKELEIYNGAVEVAGKFPDQSYTYKNKQVIKLNKNGEIHIYTQDIDTEVIISEIYMKQDGSIDITGDVINLN